MKKTFFACLGAAAVALVLQTSLTEVQAGLFNQCSPCGEVECQPCDPLCDPLCDPCEPCGKDICCDDNSCDPCEPICGRKGKGKFFVHGFLESGFWANEYGNKNVYYPKASGQHHNNVWPGNDGALQNVRNTGYQVNQAYVSIGKSVNGKCGWDFGGTVDFVFGTDAVYVQAAGLEYAAGHGWDSWGTGDYYSAFAQAYFEAEYKKLNIKAGKFYAPFSAQGFRGDQNFFYSFAPNYDFIPHTASGAYATYTVNSKLALVGGWVVPDMFGETSHNNAFLGGAVYQATKKLNLTYFFGAGTIGKEYAPNLVGVAEDVDYFVNSLVATYQISKKWKTVLDWTLFNTQIDAFDYNYTAWGVNAAVFYQYSKTLAFGARYNYVSGSNFANANFGGGRYGINSLYGNFGGVDDWTAISLGANWSPTKWLTVKPEVRWDIIDTPAGFGGYFWDRNRGHDQQFSGGVSTVVKF